MDDHEMDGLTAAYGLDVMARPGLPLGPRSIHRRLCSWAGDQQRDCVWTLFAFPIGCNAATLPDCWPRWARLSSKGKGKQVAAARCEELRCRSCGPSYSREPRWRTSACNIKWRWVAWGPCAGWLPSHCVAAPKAVLQRLVVHNCPWRDSEAWRNRSSSWFHLTSVLCPWMEALPLPLSWMCAIAADFCVLRS
ncbi:hypothetical protein BD289DRAFT_46322 [Coniella lustricola]|uniref:Uncharacterized protein n=1 Tax=Coniella lustricola TaxID=2025994 RepID=A0A2T3AIA6_9PEZI|nr:hypothetical protein BD289DRAFT_46322 [Coniella lustricola]